MPDSETISATQLGQCQVTLVVIYVETFSSIATRLPPEEVSRIHEFYLDAVTTLAQRHFGTILPSRSDEFTIVFGTPVPYADHHLLALNFVVEIREHILNARESFATSGSELPRFGAAIHTADAVAILNQTTLHVLSESLKLTHLLVSLTRTDEILITESSALHIMETRPDGYEVVRAITDDSPELDGLRMELADIRPLPESLQRHIYLFGRGVEDNQKNAEICFTYLYSIFPFNTDIPIHILNLTSQLSSHTPIPANNDVVQQENFEQRVGRYTLKTLIGRGGMGQVWFAHDWFANPVAIKFLNNRDTNEKMLMRFQREATVMRHLQHRNICRVFEFSEYEGLHYIVMEHVSGVTLSQLVKSGIKIDTTRRTLEDDTSSTQLSEIVKTIQENVPAEKDESEEHLTRPDTPSSPGTLPISQVLTIILKICDAVNFAHQHGVLHRDLKPSNIILRQDGDPVVMDFGLAKFEDDTEERSISVSHELLGTLEYMSPEQALSSKSVDERADVYSLGAIMFLLFTGKRHFEPGGNIFEDVQRLQEYEPPKPRAFAPELDPDLEVIVLKALRSEAAERYSSISALREDLDRFRKGQTINARPISLLELWQKTIRRNRAITATIASAFVLLIVLASVFIVKLNNRVKVAEEIQLEAILKGIEDEAALAEANAALQEAQEKQKNAEAELTRIQQEK